MGFLADRSNRKIRSRRGEWGGGGWQEWLTAWLTQLCGKHLVHFAPLMKTSICPVLGASLAFWCGSVFFQSLPPFWSLKLICRLYLFTSWLPWQQVQPQKAMDHYLFYSSESSKDPDSEEILNKCLSYTYRNNVLLGVWGLCFSS